MPSDSSPIRVGIIGLGISESDLTPGLWAAKAHLPYLQASSAFRITAVANSSVKSAQTSIDHHKLGSDVKAYGSPSDIAADPNVDFIVVSVRVGKHYALTKPALLAGKDIFVEWPLAATLSQAEELTALAKEKGVKNIVGVQARVSPLVIKLRSILKNNDIGTILSSTVNATFSGIPHDMFPNGAEYYLDINSGGNAFYITFGHFFDSFTHVLGPFSSPLNAVFDLKYPRTKLVDFVTMTQHAELDRTAPDHVFVQGKLASGALASIAFRTVPTHTKEVEDRFLTWTITGTEGEIVVIQKEGNWQMLESDGFVVKIRKGKGEVETVDLGVGVQEDSEAVLANKPRERNVGRVYEAFLEGQSGNFATFEQALESQKLLARIREAAEK
ncbi:Galactose/lactose metabolism regulatory protein [Lachnellula willkommii]|uniref:Galactose/lactose metabolism regulatory protein n=1 Tax=Lachnellula willkommii TaxID=215461 RepID=A0A559MAZ2_9HELO|nr:Galactose/lactose metabolism regulatory protein [Lachnellula willkommii]